MAKTILVVDDSASLRMVVKMALVNAGYNVVEAADGKQGIEMLNKNVINMTVCDLNMPVMDGIEFLKQAKVTVGYKFMPILMLTTETNSIRKDMAKEAGAKAWMSKPFTPDILVNAIKKICP